MNEEGRDRLLACAMLAVSLFALNLVDLDRVRAFCGNVVPPAGTNAIAGSVEIPFLASRFEIIALGASVAGIVFSAALLLAPNIPLPSYRAKLLTLQAVTETCGVLALGCLLASVSLWLGLGFIAISAVGVAALLWLVRPPRGRP